MHRQVPGERNKRKEPPPAEGALGIFFCGTSLGFTLPMARPEGGAVFGTQVYRLPFAKDNIYICEGNDIPHHLLEIICHVRNDIPVNMIQNLE